MGYLSTYILFCCSLIFLVNECFAQCLTPKHTETDALTRIHDLVGNRYDVIDSYTKYKYHVGICTNGLQPTDMPHDKNLNGSGVIQKEDGEQGNYFSIGKFWNTEIMEGTDWVMLEYEDGEPYHHSCEQEKRRSVIMITCDPNNAEGTIRLIEEQKNKTGDCYYLFELDHKSVCVVETQSAVSIGTVFCIVFFVVVVLYLVVGLVYKRCVMKAKGLEQIPNYTFWRDVGNLEADGCDFVCRCGSRTGQVHQYEPVGSVEDQPHNPVDYDRDDRLLPM